MKGSYKYTFAVVNLRLASTSAAYNLLFTNSIAFALRGEDYYYCQSME